MSGFDNEIMFCDGAEIGADAKDTVSSGNICKVRMDFNGPTVLDIINTDSGALANPILNFINDETTGTLSLPSSNNARSWLQNKLYLNADQANNEGMVYNVASGKSHIFYAPASNNTEVFRISSSGISLDDGSTNISSFGELAGINAIATTGLAARTADDTWTTRTITGSPSITVANGSGVSGNPTLSLPSIARLRPGYIENIGIDYNAGTGVFTVQGATEDLSSSNPGYIVLQSKADPGELTLYQITSNQSFIDDAGASEIIGNTFGTIPGTAWANDCPFYIYAVPNDAEDAIQFMLGRYPHLKQSPAAASIGAPDDPVADSELSLWSFDNIDETLYDANPCLCVGSIRMTKTSSDDWTVAAIDVQDGIGNFNEVRFFNYPLAQNGASAGTFFLPNGGTAPVFVTNQYSYKVATNGRCTIFTNIRDDGGTDGAGAVSARLSLPLRVINTQAAANNQAMANVNTVTAGAFQFCIVSFINGVNYCEFVKTAGVQVLNSDFAAGDRDLLFAGTYDLPSF